MLRLRRYRAFIVFAVVALGLFYHFKGIGYAQTSLAASVSSLKQPKGESNVVNEPKTTPSDKESERFNGPETATRSPKQTSGITIPDPTASRLADQDLKEGGLPRSSPSNLPEFQSTKANQLINELPLATIRAIETAPAALKAAHSQVLPTRRTGSLLKTAGVTVGEEEDGLQETILPVIHWSSTAEHFPVPTESLIALPTGRAARLPRIQHDFGSTLGANKSMDASKLKIIKETFEFSWAGYRAKAWKQDELSPKSGKSRNPFCGWGATLVDSLDTLWLMDMVDDFEAAIDAIKETDFTTSSRNDIPLFETVIRYLGGLIGAYDMSGGKYEILLTKAVELAEVLMGAFDTPNRMPMTFYLWKPTFASQPHRAKTRVVMAELGSLSLEFTRLAQITKQAKYYDAIARITNEFALWQNHTKLPGLWPLKVDASGCRKPQTETPTLESQDLAESKALQNSSAAPTTLHHLVTDRLNTAVQSEKSQVTQTRANSPAPTDADDTAGLGPKAKADNEGAEAFNPRGRINKREVVREKGGSQRAENGTTTKCQPQGFASPPYSTLEEFSLGGLADSTYEYLPKEYLLLDGLESKYRSMYESAADAAKEHLIYRPMIRNESRSILQAGLLRTAGKGAVGYQPEFRAEGTHLTCFAGGMFALGAKTFGRDQDMEIASKLTDGCIWAYEATKSGIMPEVFSTIRCKGLDNCPWNETLWLEATQPARLQHDSSKLDHGKQHVLKDDSEASGDPSETVRTKSIAGTTEGTSMSAKANALANTRSQQTLPPITSDDTEDAPVTKTEPLTFPDTSKDPARSSWSKDSPSESLSSSSTAALLSTSAARGRLFEKRQLGEVDSRSQSAADDSSRERASTKSRKNTKDQGGGSTHMSKDGTRSETFSSKEFDPIVAGQTKNSEAAQDALVMGESEHRTSTQASFSSDPHDATDKTRHDTVTDSVSNTGAQAALADSPMNGTLEEVELPLGMTRIISSRYLLRPEAIESVFVMYRITGDNYWRKQGWVMFEAIEKQTKSTYGASAIADVNEDGSEQIDEMESFWLAETLKYFYLLFSDPDTLSLDDYVLNTEAHPLKRPKKS